VAKQSTHNPKIEGSNPTTGIGSEKFGKQTLGFKWVLKLATIDLKEYT
jgi:hypothetical protein